MRIELKSLALALFFFSSCVSAQGKSVPANEQLVEMFSAMAANTTWDLSKPMLWGYFFTDGSSEKLELAVPLLQKQGYHFVNIYLSEKKSPNEPNLWWLHVEKVEVHSPDSLSQRNKALEKFAAGQGLGSYDGMDVGPDHAVN